MRAAAGVYFARTGERAGGDLRGEDGRVLRLVHGVVLRLREPADEAQIDADQNGDGGGDERQAGDAHGGDGETGNDVRRKQQHRAADNRKPAEQTDDDGGQAVEVMMCGDHRAADAEAERGGDEHQRAVLEERGQERPHDRRVHGDAKAEEDEKEAKALGETARHRRLLFAHVNCSGLMSIDIASARASSAPLGIVEGGGARGACAPTTRAARAMSPRLVDLGPAVDFGGASRPAPSASRRMRKRPIRGTIERRPHEQRGHRAVIVGEARAWRQVQATRPSASRPGNSVSRRLARAMCRTRNTNRRGGP